MDYLNPLANNLVRACGGETARAGDSAQSAVDARHADELPRIYSHLVWLGTHAIDLGAMTVFLYCFREREEILNLFEPVCGSA